MLIEIKDAAVDVVSVTAKEGQQGEAEAGQVECVVKLRRRIKVPALEAERSLAASVQRLVTAAADALHEGTLGGFSCKVRPTRGMKGARVLTLLGESELKVPAALSGMPCVVLEDFETASLEWAMEVMGSPAEFGVLGGLVGKTATATIYDPQQKLDV